MALYGFAEVLHLQLAFQQTLRRAFSAKPSRPDASHHHQEAALIVLYTVVYPFA
jgi:hypothetical protein